MKTRTGRQGELDELGIRLGWRRGPFNSWKAKGYTLAVADRGDPRKLIARRRRELHEFRTAGELERFVVARRRG